MGIFDRLGEVLKSYLNDEEGRVFGRGHEETPGFRKERRGDPDLEAAFEELDEFLNREKSFRQDAAGPESRGPGRSYRENAGNGRSGGMRVPESLKPDFAELGLLPGASEEECKAAYKKLLKLHHPDRHAGHAGNMKKATEKSARINAAFDRIEKWRRTGQTG
ncbi:MAG: J domain-containing protein [Treponema sp.]|jgi:hypothetical protein|nr:J domain-containing protein [Treponema sp.]